MAGEFDQITGALKIAYPPKMIEPMVNAETPFRAKLKKSLPAGGRVTEGIVKFGANFAPPQNVGQTADGGSLPSPIDRTQDQFQLVPTLFPGGFQIGWITKAAAGSNKSAFNGGELRRRTEETIQDLAKFIDSTYVGTHGTGRRARVESDGANNFVAALPEGIQLLRENFRISVRTTDGGAGVRDSCDNRRITAIDPATRTVTYSGADQTLVAGDHVHVVVEAAQTLTSIFANGLRGIVDDSTFLGSLHGLSRVTYPKLNANVKANGGTLRNLTEQILINACHESRQRVGKRVTDIWTNTGQIEKYIEFVAPDRRYNVDGPGTQPKGTGYEEGQLVHYAPGVAAKFNISFDMVAREIFLLNWDTFFHYVAQEMDWWDDGNMLKPTPNSTTYKASYLAFVSSIENIGCDMPLANTVIRDLRDPLIGDA